MMDFSFAGCGFLGIYHLGAAVCLKQYTPHILRRIYGTSCGALVATCLLCDIPLGQILSDFLHVVNETRSYLFGPFSPKCNIQKSILDRLEELLPDDAHELVNGRLFISLTRLYDSKNVIVSHFNDRYELLQALKCSCFIPGFSGIIPPTFSDIRYINGSFTNNLPIFDQNTITISPYCGETDICPRDESAQLYHIGLSNSLIEISRENFKRVTNSLFLPNVEILSEMYQQGFNDALEFIHKKKFVQSTRCLIVESIFSAQQCLNVKRNSDEKNQVKGAADNTLMPWLTSAVSTLNPTVELTNNDMFFQNYGNKLYNLISSSITPSVDMISATLKCTRGDYSETRKYEQTLLATGYKILARTQNVTNSIESERTSLRNMVKNQLLNTTKYILAELKTKTTTKYKDSQSQDVSVSKEYTISEMGITSRIDKNREIILSEDEAINSFEDGNINQLIQATVGEKAFHVYFFKNENTKKIKVLKYFDLTESELPTLQTVDEIAINSELQFDDEIDEELNNFSFNNNLSINNDEMDIFTNTTISWPKIDCELNGHDCDSKELQNEDSNNESLLSDKALECLTRGPQLM